MTLDLSGFPNGGPRSLAVFDLIAKAIETGDLAPGERLPSQRWLAEQLGVALGTVTRAYRKAGERGLIRGEAGRGSFVTWTRRRQSDENFPRAPSDHLIDLARNRPVAVPEEKDIWQATFEWMARNSDLAARLRGGDRAPSSSLAVAGRRWLARLGWEMPETRIVGCHGVGAALDAVLGVGGRPGQGLAMAASSHPAVVRRVMEHGLTPVPLREDAEGVLPQSLEDACSESKPGLVLLEPTLGDPTTRLASGYRREQLATVARDHDLSVIELDGNLHLLDERLPTVSRLVPERAFFIADTRFALSASVRVAFVASPESVHERIAAAAAARSGLATALAGEVVGGWIDSGVADDLTSARRRELSARHAIVLGALGDRGLLSHPAAHQAWLHLPRGRRSELFVYRAEQAGVAITDGAWFRLPGTQAGEAVRICYGNAIDRGSLSRAMEPLRLLLEEDRRSGPPLL